MIPSGLSSQFAGLLTLECADYAEYTIGRTMNAMTNSIYNLSQKAASAIGGVIPGLLLMTVGYSVNSKTGAYAAELSQLPHMVSGLAFIMSLIPAAMSIASFVIYRTLYKITPELREKIKTELNLRHYEQQKAVEAVRN